MKRLVYSDDSVQRFKVGDDSTQIVLVPLTTDDDVNNTVDLSNQDCTVLIRNKNTYITKLVPEIDGTRVKFTSKNLARLLPDEYFLELWTMDKTTHESKVYPDRDFLPLFINENAYGETGDPIKNVNMDVLREEMKAYIQEETKKLNLDDYYTKEQVDSAIKSNKVDLTPYLTITDAEKTYAKTTDVPRVVLNTSDRTLSIGDTSINIPNTVDLSGYAKSDQVPNITYDKSSNSINLNGVTIPIGGKVDLSDYYTKEQVDSAIKSNKVDLKPYLTVTDAQKTYAKATDVPRVVLNTSDRTLSVGSTSINIPDSVDLSGYAKSDQIPNITYDKSSNSINLNGVNIPIGNKVDLSDYYTKNQVISAISTAISSHRVDLGPYLTIKDADNTYARTDDVPRVVLNTSDRTLSVGDTSINIPDSVDLSGYAKSDQIPNITYDKSSNSINLNGVNIPISGKVDLSDYYTKEQVDSAIKSNKVDLTPYLTVTDAEKTYAKTTDIPRITLNTSDRKLSVGNTSINIPDNVDLTGYAKSNQIPNITYDKSSNSINLNGVNIPISGKVDLSDYYTKEQVDLAIKSNKVDLTPYLTIADAEHKFISYKDTGINTIKTTVDDKLFGRKVDYEIPTTHYFEAGIPYFSKSSLIFSKSTTNQKGTFVILDTADFVGGDVYVPNKSLIITANGNIYQRNDDPKQSGLGSFITKYIGNVKDLDLFKNVFSKSSSATYSTNFSPRLTGDQPVTDWNITPDNLTSKLGDTTYEFIKLNDGDQRDELSPSASDLNNAKRTTSADNLQEGVCWLAITNGNGWQEEKQYPFGSAWYLDSVSPLSATVKVVQYDKVAKKYVVPTQGGAALMSLLPGKQSITAGMLNNGYQIRPYLDNMTPWVATDYVAGGDYVHNDWFKAMVGKKVSQMFNILMTGSPEPEGSTTLVNYPSKDSTDDNKQATAPVTLLVTKIGNGTGSLSINGNDVDKTMLTYQHPEVVNDQYELKFTGNYDGYIMITAYKGDHLVVIRKNGHALPATRKYMTTGAQAFTPAYITKLNSGNNNETLYPFGIRPIHVTLANS